MAFQSSGALHFGYGERTVMERKAPAARGDEGRETLGGSFSGSLTTTAYRAQIVAARFALPIETAAIIAALAWGAHHG